MAYKCPNTNLREWKLLREAVGPRKAYQVYDANGQEIPTEEDLDQWVEWQSSQDSTLSELNKATSFEDIMNNIDNPNVEKLPNQAGYKNLKTGKIVNKRVSDLVKEYARKTNQAFTGEPDQFYGKKGTVLHAYMEEIGRKVVAGEDFSMKDVQQEVFKLLDLESFADETEAFMRITPKQYNQLKKGVTNLIESVKEIQNTYVDSEGSVEFRFELPILDPTRDVAGTVDMVAIFSDGSAAVYDFKSYSRPGKQPPGQRVINKWNIQMANYKNILKDVYGVNKFRQSRAIPIQVSYTKKDRTTGEYINKISEGFQRIAIQHEKNAQAFKHLNAIPVEELTGDEALDRLINKLIQERDQTERLFASAKPEDKSRLLNKLSRINNSLKNIQLNRDISGMVDDVKKLYKKYNKRLTVPRTDSKYMSMSELLDALGETKLYENLAINYSNQLQHLAKDKKEKVKKGLSSAQTSMRALQENILQEIEMRVGREILGPGEVVSIPTKIWGGLQNWNVPVFQRLNELVRYAEEQTRRSTLNEFDDIAETDKAFSKWASANGYSQTGKFDLIYNEKTGQLHKKYQEEFWEKRFEIRDKARKKEKLTSSEKKWLKEHFEFDRERYEEYRDLMIDNIDHKVEIGEITQQEADEQKAWFYSTNSIDSDPSNFFSTTYLSPKDETSQDYLSDTWKFIQQHEPVKNYYDMYLNYNEQWTQEFGRDAIGKYFVANVRSNMWDRLVEFGPSSLGDLPQIYRKQLEIHQQDELQGATDANGNSLAKVPLLYTDAAYEYLSDKEVDAIEAEVAVTHERGTPEFETEVERRVKEKGKEKGLKLKSKDLTKSLMAMVYSANNNIHTTAIETEVKALKALIENKRIETQQLTEQDTAAIKEFTGGVIKKMGLAPDVADAFNFFVDKLVYGKSLQKDKLLFGKYSANKIAKQLMNFFSIRALGLNHTIQIADFIQGKSSLWMMAKEGRYFNKGNYKDVINMWSSRDEQFQNVVEFWQPQSRDIPSERIEEAGATTISRQFRQRNLFIGYLWSDDNIGATILASMAQHYVIDNGQIKNPKFDKIESENPPTVFESVKKNEDGQLYIPGLTVEEFARFRDKVQKQSNLIRGSATERQKGTITRTMVGQALMQFRTWIPGLAEARFAKLKYDSTMEQFERGRFGAALGDIIGNGFLPSVREAMKIIASVVSMGLYTKSPNTEAVQREFDKFLNENPQYKGQFTKEQFIQLQKDKLRGFIAEARVYLAFFVLVQLLGGLDWDEESEELDGSIFTWQAHNVARRALLEASFWWSPKSVDEIIKSPLAIWGLFREVDKIFGNAITETSYAVKGERDPRDKTPFGYYILKNTPAVNQVLGIFNFFERYNPPKGAIERILNDDED